jgi:transcriptional regulator with XRE-family HTH domain
LRRSEVALIAGISTEYYVKLEQGQETRPTDQVLDALSRALRLDATATSYLHALARLTSRPLRPVVSVATERARWLIDSWPMTAAMVLDRHFDIVATNALMSALVEAYQVGRNAVALMLLEPAMRELYVEWDGLSERTIGLLRSEVGLHPDDARNQELVAQLTRESARFKELWHRHDTRAMTEGSHPLHPVVGPLSLHFTQLPLVNSDGHSLFAYYAEPGTPTERALAELAPGR